MDTRVQNSVDDRVDRAADACHVKVEDIHLSGECELTNDTSKQFNYDHLHVACSEGKKDDEERLRDPYLVSHYATVPSWARDGETLLICLHDAENTPVAEHDNSGWDKKITDTR